MCVRSGAWTEKDWRLDFERKMKRHTAKNGMLRESLAESSHDAWIHLYRSGPYTRENQISYYLEGELALLCLDTEMRRRNGNTFGAKRPDGRIGSTLRHSFGRGGTHGRGLQRHSRDPQTVPRWRKHGRTSTAWSSIETCPTCSGRCPRSV